ncbi:uncharacterized protein EAE98_006544 [Botrytis deweyae]|uniref:Inhibitor I9 domain-containing protein n=1 Tax=Botrytis deweyae TaxID=2478750 RepID=A0ABQ7IJM6_9HELO|nr:uncharacterized protein EAE98_006544 [Botrytis deweyae]KAF7926249.1 hypothetical protein EAE98_006544 [Botrytis deweyae]
MVYPEGDFPTPTDITDPIQQLLESFGPQSETQLRTATSLNGWGIMYWSLLLTPSEVKMLEENPLVYEVSQAVVAGTDDF